MEKMFHVQSENLSGSLSQPTVSSDAKPNTSCESSVEKKTNKIKCTLCGKKVSLVEQEYCKCQCSNFYCSAHRTAGVSNTDRSHECKFDYKQKWTSQYNSTNRAIVVDKIIKI